MKTIIILFLLGMIVNESMAQQKLIASNRFLKNVNKSASLPNQKRLKNDMQYKIPGKRASQFTPEEWGSIIDSTWGPGQSADAQRTIFDTYWSVVDQQWAGFPNHPVDWDSLRDAYRPQIGSGLSRGMFYSLMSRMWLALSEFHTWIYDPKVDTTFGFNTFNYRPGVPLLCIGPGPGNMLGAAVTSLDDSTNLVYRIAADNPLGLEPGDLILGYEGISWKRQYPQLLKAGLPVSRVYSIPGTTSESMTYSFLMAVGFNWGLFDTIDIVKYFSGDTLHLPTALLDTTIQTVWSSDQVPVPGVPMPEAPSSAVAVSWGVAAETSIGYIYVWDWLSNESRLLFQNAVTDLLQNQTVKGLIFDFRMNWGGDPSYSYGGFSQLFNFDPTPNLSRASRNSKTDQMSFNFYGTIWGTLQPTNLYDRPIAILIGPGTLSAGDICALYLSYHPMARVFGRPSNGAFVGDNYTTGAISGGWQYQVPTSVLFSNVPETGFLIHRGLEPDEEIWLTRDDVAKGEDTVVKRALEWIQNLAHAHDVSVDKTFIRPNQDTVTISAIVENPNHHPLTVLATLLNDSNTVPDSVYLYDDGLHHDGHSGDKIWANSYYYNSGIEQTVRVSVSSDDPVAGNKQCMPNVTAFTSIGPLVLEGTRNTSTDQEINAGDYIRFKFTLRNESSSATAINVTSCVVALDTCASITNLTKCTFGDLAPGASVEGGGSQYIRFNKNCPGQTARFALEIYSDIYHLWSDTFTVDIVSGLEDGTDDIITTYDLCQNYPNPFNPVTQIHYQLPQVSQVDLSIYNLLGQKVATLVSEQQSAGRYNVQWDATGFASGVYLYRLETKGYSETKKLVLMR